MQADIDKHIEEKK